jgi:hypothetical protein
MSGVLNKAGSDSGVIGVTEGASGGGGGGGGISTHDAVASGTLANGDRVILRADGKVKVVGMEGGSLETITADDQNETLDGNNGNVRYENPMVHFDPNDSNKFGIMHRNPNSNNYEMIIGIINGSAIEFQGGEWDIGSGSTNGGGNFCWHPKCTDIIICTYGNGPPGGSGWMVKVGKVVGNQVNLTGTYPSAVVGDGLIDDYTQASHFSIDADSQSSTTDRNQFAISCHFTDGMPNLLKMAPGWISDDGTSLTMGDVTDVSDDPMGFSPQLHAVKFDPFTEGRFVHFWHDNNSSDEPRVDVNTITHEELPLPKPLISSGSAQVVDSGNAGDGRKDIQWLSANKVVCSWRKQNYPYLRIGTVSGDAPPLGSYSISWGTMLQLSTQQDPTWNIHMSSIDATRFYAQGKDGNKIIGKVIDVSGTTMTVRATTTDLMDLTASGGGVNLQFGAVSADGTKIVTRGLLGSNATDYSKFSTSQIGTAAATNLAAGNFIGISDGAYSDGATATIQLSSPSIDDSQSGLTPGSTYYVQTDGSLSTTPGTPSVLAGIALSATQLLIKG